MSFCVRLVDGMVQLSRHAEAVAESTKAVRDDNLYAKAYERRAASLFELGAGRWRITAVFVDVSKLGVTFRWRAFVVILLLGTVM